MVKLFKSQFIFIGGLMLLMSTGAQAAQPICDTIAECQASRAQVDARIKELRVGQMPAFLDIAKDAYGKVKFMNQANAVQYCSAQGAHLPSARELAQLAMSLGAKGIVDSCGSENKCYSVKATNANGSSDNFNYSYKRYQPPAGDLSSLFPAGSNRFWSSSGIPNHYGDAFGFSGDVGVIEGYDRADSGRAVRCVSGR